MTLMIAYGDGKSVGAKEQALAERIADLAEAQPSEYLQGKNDAFEGARAFIKSARLGLPMPDTHWFNYVKEKAQGFANVDEAVAALAQAKGLSVEEARNTVMDRIEASTRKHKSEGYDDFISKLAAEESVIEQIAMELSDA